VTVARPPGGSPSRGPGAGAARLADVHSGALIRYRVMAWVTGVVLATSCLIGLSFEPWAVGESVRGVLWTAHGYLYLLYVVAAFHLSVKARWKPVKTLLVLLAGTVPLMSFVAERRVVHDESRRASSPSQPATSAAG
jgi:integral membrane protein